MKEERRKAGEIAMEAMQRKMKNLKVDFSDSIDFLTKHYGFKNRPDLYYAFATGELKMSDFKKFEVVQGKLVLKQIEEPKAVTDNEPKGVKRPRKTAAKPSKSNILIAGEPIDQYQYELATCCKPVQGDDIFGYLTSNQMLKVHRINCNNSTDLLANYGYRVLKAEWTNTIGNNYLVDIKVTGVDSVGLIQKLTHELSVNLGVNIRSFTISGNEGIFEGIIGIVVINKDQLTKVIKSLEKLDGISTVQRVYKSDNEL